MSKPYILAIDDYPDRYFHLDDILTRASKNIDVKFVGCPWCIAAHVNDASAILLDFDMVSTTECYNCNKSISIDTTLEVIDLIIKANTNKNIPVIISSCSSISNKQLLEKILSERKILTKIISADHFGVELEWIGQLYLWNIMP